MHNSIKLATNRFALTSLAFTLGGMVAGSASWTQRTPTSPSLTECGTSSNPCGDTGIITWYSDFVNTESYLIDSDEVWVHGWPCSHVTIDRDESGDTNGTISDYKSTSAKYSAYSIWDWTGSGGGTAFDVLLQIQGTIRYDTIGNATLTTVNNPTSALADSSTLQIVDVYSQVDEGTSFTNNPDARYYDYCPLVVDCEHDTVGDYNSSACLTSPFTNMGTGSYELNDDVFISGSTTYSYSAGAQAFRIDVKIATTASAQTHINLDAGEVGDVYANAEVEFDARGGSNGAYAKVDWTP